MSSSRFRDRRDAGRALAELLRRYAGRADVIVLALPRGGVPVAAEVAKTLGAPLDLFLVRKLGVPGHEELAMGALATGGVRVLNEDVIRALRVSRADVEAVTAEERHELERRERRYRGNRPLPDVKGKTVILIDDGLATGSTMLAAVRALREEGPAQIVVAVPVAAAETCDDFRGVVDEIVCAATPEPFIAVGLWYEDFAQTTDEEVQELLREQTGEPAAAPRTADTRAVMIEADGVRLAGDLTIPDDPTGVVLFAHGSGSSRHSSRNKLVAAELQNAGFATLLMDLLTPNEEESDRWTAQLRFDIPLLALRVVAATRWLLAQRETHALPLGYFGASTGAGAALIAAAELPDVVAAVVSRGGRPDLAGDALPRVQAPTLLIVGSEDTPVIHLNDEARQRMRAEVRLVVVSGATHLFEEPGTLEEVAALARDWFLAKMHRAAGADR
jgi:putative phosphoribosyl transferase